MMKAVCMWCFRGVVKGEWKTPMDTIEKTFVELGTGIKVHTRWYVRASLVETIWVQYVCMKVMTS